MKKIYFAFIAISLFSSAALPQTEGMNPHMGVFLSALKDGHAQEPVPNISIFQPAVDELKRKTGNSGPILISASLLKRFTQQSSCGRIEFHLVQPDSGRSWPNIGGQFNICEAGTPPLMVCPPNLDRLVEPNTICSTGKRPVPTKEVAEAIKEAIVHGGVSPDMLAKGRPSKQPK